MAGGTSDVYNWLYNPQLYYDPRTQSYRTPGFSQATFWQDPTPVRAVPEIRTDPTVTPTPPDNSAAAALRGVFASRPTTEGGSPNGGDIVAGLDPLGGQEIGPGGMGWRDQVDAIGRYIGDLITASPTGNRYADAALMAGSAALGLPPGLGTMAGLARGASRAPFDESINPWAGTRFDENGQPVTRTGPPVPQDMLGFLPGVPTDDQAVRPDENALPEVPAEDARFLPTMPQVPAEEARFLPGPLTTASLSEKRTGEGDTAGDAGGKGGSAGGKTGGGDVSASTSAEGGASKGDVSGSTGYGGDKGGGDGASGAGSEAGGGGKGEGATGGGDVSGSSSAGEGYGGGGDGNGGGVGGQDAAGAGDPGGSDSSGHGLARGGRVTKRNAARSGNPPGPDNLYAALQTGETVIPRGVTQGVQAGDPGSAMAALQSIRTGAPAGRPPAPAPAKRPPPPRGAMAALGAVKGKRTSAPRR